MKKAYIFLAVSVVQAVLICSFTGLISIWIGDQRFDHAIRIGWPFTFFTAFDQKNDTLNYSGDVGALVLDLAVAFLIAVVWSWVLRRLFLVTK